MSKKPTESIYPASADPPVDLWTWPNTKPSWLGLSCGGDWVDTTVQRLGWHFFWNSAWSEFPQNSWICVNNYKYSICLHINFSIFLNREITLPGSHYAPVVSQSCCNFLIYKNLCWFWKSVKYISATYNVMDMKIAWKLGERMSLKLAFNI